MFCACDPCLLFDFSKCEMAAQRGAMASVTTPLKKGEVARTKEIDSLVEWGALLKRDGHGGGGASRCTRVGA
jgi:hypothetical protein